MPATCVNEQGVSLVSFDYSQPDWEALKSEYLNHGLRMKCCGADAIPKTSHLGTRFLSHKSDACGAKPESPEHLRCKEIIVNAARQSGWEALPEEPGQDPDGNRWEADVLCRKGTTVVIFEVQLSGQTFSECKERTNRYAASNAKCFWLTRRGGVRSMAIQMVSDRIGSTQPKDIIGQKSDRIDMPAFELTFDNLDDITVFFPWHHGLGPYQISLGEFVKGALSGRVNFREDSWCWG